MKFNKNKKLSMVVMLVGSLVLLGVYWRNMGLNELIKVKHVFPVEKLAAKSVNYFRNNPLLLKRDGYGRLIETDVVVKGRVVPSLSQKLCDPHPCPPDKVQILIDESDDRKSFSLWDELVISFEVNGGKRVNNFSQKLNDPKKVYVMKGRLFGYMRDDKLVLSRFEPLEIWE